MTDLTTVALVPEDGPGRAEIRAKAAGVIAGSFVAIEVFSQTGAEYEEAVNDGAGVTPGTLVGRVKGPLRSLLHGERTALNILGRLSGIATLTGRFADGAKGSRAPDPRHPEDNPPLPVAREVRGPGRRRREPPHGALRPGAGEGEPHRRGAGVRGRSELRRRRPPAHEGGQAGDRGGDRGDEPLGAAHRPRGASRLRAVRQLQLTDLALAVRIRDDWPGEGRPEIEASGGVTLANVAKVAATGVDRISVGALTHSAPALDLSMKIMGD